MMRKINRRENRKNRTKKALCLTLSAAMVFGTAGCGQQTADQAAGITEEGEEQFLQDVLHAQIGPSHSSQAGKEETVYVLADANGSVHQVIVSDWLKNKEGGARLTDSSDLQDIRNVKGYETYETDEDGNIVWQAEGADIYYRGTTEKEVPVEVKVSYQLDGKEISPEELAGKSGRVTIRLDYENKETKTVTVGGKEQEIKIPFAMISGMILPQDTFSNIEVTNARLLSEGDNSIVVGVAFPGLKESIDMEGLQDKLEDTEKGEEFKELEIPDHIEVSADTESFALGMTMTVAMSDILSDLTLTDSLDLSDLQDSMDELQDAAEQLKDGTVELKDGSGKLKDGTESLVSGTGELWDGTVELEDGAGQLKDGALRLEDGAVQLQDGTQELYEKSGLLNDGVLALYDGTAKLKDGTRKLQDGTEVLQAGGSKLYDGTGNLVMGVESLNSGALFLQSGIDQMVSQVTTQMGMLQAKVGTPVHSSDEFDATNPSTLLQLSCLLQEALKTASSSDGLADSCYDAILQNLQQQKAQKQEDLDRSNADLAAARERAAAAQTELMETCQGSVQEIETVTGSHEEENYVDVTVEAPVYTTTRTVTERTAGEDGEEDRETTVEESTEVETQSVTGTGVVTVEVVETEQMQIQSVDTEALRQRADAYQSAMEEVAVCQARADACAMQIASLEEQIAQMDDAGEAVQREQMALMEKWGPAVTYAAYMDQALQELAGALNTAGSAEQLAALKEGAGKLADGTQSALVGAKELNNGARELKDGISSLGSGASELVDGAGTLRDGAAELKKGTGQLVDGAGKLNNGAETLRDGTGTLRDGADKLHDGVVTLQDGAGTLRDGAVELDDGMGTLDDGALELLDGMFTFDEEGIRKLTDLFGDDVQDVVDRLKAVADAGKAYNTFTSLPEEVDGSVKFIIKTEAVEP